MEDFYCYYIVKYFPYREIYSSNNFIYQRYVEVTKIIYESPEIRIITRECKIYFDYDKKAHAYEMRKSDWMACSTEIARGPIKRGEISLLYVIENNGNVRLPTKEEREDPDNWTCKKYYNDFLAEISDVYDKITLALTQKDNTHSLSQENYEE